MKNYIQPGNMIPLTMAAIVKSGDPVMIGSIFGVAAIDGAIGESINCAVVGVYDLPKATGVVAQGAPIYWDASAKKVTTDDDEGENPLIGAAILGALSGAPTARVRLNGAAS